MVHVRIRSVMGGTRSTSWLALTALLVLCSCWMLAGGQTCSLSGTYYIASELL